MSRMVAGRLPVRIIAAALITVLLSYLGGRQIAQAGESAFLQLVVAATGAGVGALVLIRPHIGVIALLAILPVNTVLAELPLGGVLSSLLGVLTVGSYLMQYRWGQERASVIPLQWIHIMAMLFIGWIFASAPYAAVFGGDRNWLFTFAQLGALLYLSGALLQSPRRQNEALVAFAAAAVISALAAIVENVSLFGGDVGFREIRAGGLAGINTGARYFLAASIAIIYLRGLTQKGALRIFGLAAIFVLILGVIATGSRTGILLLPVVVGFVLVSRNYRSRSAPIILLAAILLALLILVAGIFQSDLLEVFIPLSNVGEETTDVRLILWRSARQMWQDNPLFGVGVGQFSSLLPRYAGGILPPDRLNAGSHSIYLGLLAETGMPGLLLFTGISIASLVAFWRTSGRRDDTYTKLALTWQAILILLLLGGITKHDQYDKLLWFVFGIGAFYAHLWRSRQLKQTSLKTRVPATGESIG